MAIGMQAPRLFSSFLTAALTCLLVLGTPNGHAEIRPNIGNGLPLMDAQLNEANPFAAMPAQSPRTHAMALMGESPLPPVPEKTKQRFSQADAGGSATCGVLQGSRRILCWGRNDLGQASPPVGKYHFVAMGENHGCALTTQGGLRCWGVPTAYPTAEQAKGRFLSVAAGDDHTCAIRSNHKLVCWGNNDNGELNVPPGKFRQVVARGDHSCGVTHDRRLLCWGEKAFTEYSQTIHMPVKKVATGQLHACALGTDGLAKCWGNGIHGENQAPADRFIDIVAGDWHTCGLRADHTALCWGRDNYGQTQVGMDKYRLIAGGGMQTCGILRGSRHLTCHGSFANNEVWYPQDQNALIRASQQDGQVRPQLAFLSLFEGVSGLLASGIVNTGKMVDQKMEKWEGKLVPVQLTALVINMFLGWFGPKPVDPTIKIFDTLKDIQTDIRNIETGIDELKAQLNRTDLAVVQSWCDQQLDDYSNAYNLLDGEAGGSTSGARNAYIQLLKKQEAVLSQSIDQQKLTTYPTAELEKFRDGYLAQIQSARTRLANSLIGADKGQTAAFSACFEKGYLEWKSRVAADAKVYPFDDRGIYEHVYQVLRGALLMQAEMLSMEQDMEMQRAYQKLVEPRADTVPPIDFNPQEHALGFCLYADERKDNSHPEYSPRWVDVALICQDNRNRIQNAYIEMVKQVEFVGGAYSDDQVVLSLTATQMGLKEPKEPEKAGKNWLWVRNIRDESWYLTINYTHGGVTGRWKDFEPDSESSPFIPDPKARYQWTPPVNKASDAGIYFTNRGCWNSDCKEETFDKGVWHSNGQAWEDIYTFRKLRRMEGKSEKSQEDLLESMNQLPDTLTAACERDEKGNCKTKVVANGQVAIIPGPHLPLFTGLLNKPFWIPEKTFEFDARSRFNVGYFFDGERRHKFKMNCFAMSKINKHPVGEQDLWYRDPRIGYFFDEAEWSKSRPDDWKQSWLALTGMVCNSEEMAAALGEHVIGDNIEGGRCWSSIPPFYCAGLNYDKNTAPGVGSWLLRARQIDNILEDDVEFDNYRDNQFKPRSDGNMYHMPVVDISERKCKTAMTADINGETKPRLNERKAKGIGIPSICGEDLDKLISEIIPRPEFPPVDEKLVRFPEVNN